MSAVQLCGGIAEPIHWPMTPMKIYGTIPGKDIPLFRIVFASSVKHLVGGEFTNPTTGSVEFSGYQPVPTYGHIGDKWIMEKWVSGFDFTKQTPAQYDAQWKDPYTGL